MSESWDADFDFDLEETTQPNNQDFEIPDFGSSSDDDSLASLDKNQVIIPPPGKIFDDQDRKYQNAKISPPPKITQPPKIAQPPTSRSVTLSSGDLAPAPPTGNGMALVGISADPTMQESWDDDFDFDLDDDTATETASDTVVTNVTQPPKITRPPKIKQPPTSQSDFSSAALAPSLQTGNNKALVGISADPTMQESWDDDFDLDIDDNTTAAAASAAAATAVPNKSQSVETNDANQLTLSTFDDIEKEVDGFVDFEDDGFSDVTSDEDEEDEEDWDAEMGFQENNATNDDVSSDESDWDAEFDEDEGLDTKTQTSNKDDKNNGVEKSQFTMHLGMIRNLIQDVQQGGLEQDGAFVPRQYCLIDASGDNNYKVERYPPACETYSVHPSDGFKRMPLRDVLDDQNRLKTMGLETWLKTIAQGKNGVRRTEYLQGGSSKRRRSMVGLHSRRGDTTKLQAGWSDTYLREAWTIYRKPYDHGKLWILLTDFFETLALLQKEIRGGGGTPTLKGSGSGGSRSGNKHSTGWNHVFQNSLSLLRLGCKARQSMHSVIDNNNGSWPNNELRSGSSSSSGGGSSSRRGSSSNNSDSSGSSRSVNSRRSLVAKKTSIRGSSKENPDRLLRRRYTKMINVLHDTFPQFKLSIDIVEIRAAAHMMSSTTSYLIYINEDGSIDTITESEDSPIYLKWITPPKYLEARMVDEEDDDDEMRAGKFKSEGASL